MKVLICKSPIANCNNRDFPEKINCTQLHKLFIIKIFCLVLLFASTAGSCIGQTTKSTNTKNDYLKKSRNQQTVGWVLLGGGFVVTMVGVGVASNNFWEDIITGKESARGTGAAITGVAMMAGSVPLFIASGKNRRKAFSLSFTNQKLPYLYKNRLTNESAPSVTLIVSL
jgi:hypothetical protein